MYIIDDFNKIKIFSNFTKKKMDFFLNLFLSNLLTYLPNRSSRVSSRDQRLQSGQKIGSKNLTEL